VHISAGHISTPVKACNPIASDILKGTLIGAGRHVHRVAVVIVVACWTVAPAQRFRLSGISALFAEMEVAIKPMHSVKAMIFMFAIARDRN
jgi:hypothetical protein